MKIKKTIQRHPYVLIFIITTLIYFFSSAGNTPYNYFTRLADAFLHGRYWLSDNPPWLSELIPAGENRFYVVYPPLPAIIAMPFVFLFGKNFPQQFIAHLLGSGILILTIKLSLLVKRDFKLALWSGALIGLGSIVFFLSSVGSSWYLGQITAAFFLTAAILESLSHKRSLVLGVLLGAAYLSRINTLLAVPFVYLLMENRFHLTRKAIPLIIGIIPFLFFNLIYNYVRFSVLWDKGYFLLPSVLNETTAPWFIKGVIHPSYIINNLKTAFFSFPKIISHFPYIQPSWAGLAIWITTPAFIFSIKAQLNKFVIKISWLAIAFIFLSVAMHGGTGFAQFGYRFAVDFYPFLALLTIYGVSRSQLKSVHWILLLVSFFVNLWGVLWINKFGWVSY